MFLINFSVCYCMILHVHDSKTLPLKSGTRNGIETSGKLTENMHQSKKQQNNEMTMKALTNSYTIIIYTVKFFCNKIIGFYLFMFLILIL